MPPHRIIRLSLQYVFLCIVNLSYSGTPIEHLEDSVNLPYVQTSETAQPGEIDCENLHGLKSGDDDNGQAFSIPPDVCGLCPTGPHDLEQCECISMAHKFAGSISINCDASTQWTTVDELKEMFNSVQDYVSTHVFRFTMIGTNVRGSLNKFVWGPLVFRQIIMDNNKIQTIDNEAFAGSDNMTVLSLKNNEIVYFHWDVLRELPQLYTLWLQGNRLTYIPSAVFPPTNLAYVDLSRNTIGEIGPNAFDKLHKLRKLNLSNNKLTSLADNTFSISQHNPGEFNDLQIILSNNQISYISMDAFANVQPVVLDLSNNLLTTIDMYAFGPLVYGSNLRIIVDLLDNPIVCDCNIYWMIMPLIKDQFSNFVCYDEYGDPTDIYFDDLQPHIPPPCLSTGSY